MADNKGVLAILGLASGITAIYFLTKKKELAATGEKVIIKEALASISPKLIQAWVKRGSAWYGYDPNNVEATTLTYIQGNEYIEIQVTEACTLVYSGKGYNINIPLGVMNNGWNIIQWK